MMLKGSKYGLNVADNSVSSEDIISAKPRMVQMWLNIYSL